MRLIGHLADESTARTFGDYLYVQGIENQLEAETARAWGVWINDEDKIDGAAALLRAFLQNPADPRFRHQARTAPQSRAEEAKEQATHRKKLRNRRHLVRPLTPYGFGALTLLLI